jgi:hypothetical protein
VVGCKRAMGRIIQNDEKAAGEYFCEDKGQ